MIATNACSKRMSPVALEPKDDQNKTMFFVFFRNGGMQTGWLLETWIVLGTNEPNFLYPILIHNRSHVK